MGFEMRPAVHQPRVTAIGGRSARIYTGNLATSERSVPTNRWSN